MQLTYLFLLFLFKGCGSWSKQRNGAADFGSLCCQTPMSSDTPEDIGVIVEGCTVLQALSDVAKGCGLLLGLIYTL